jgi:hypothetical protein
MTEMPNPQKYEQRECRDYEVVVSDRIALAQIAVKVLDNIMLKQAYPVISDRMDAPEIPLTAQEHSTLDSALRYLQRQFDDGHRDTSVEPKRVEKINVLEYPTPSPAEATTPASS